MTAETHNNTQANDFILPFQIETAPIRGRLVRLGTTLDEVMSRHGYEDEPARLLGESLALTAAMAGNLKFQGSFTFQARGDGPVPLLVADFFTPSAMRGYASIKGEAFAVWRDQGHRVTSRDLKSLLGRGVLAFTIDQGADMERYQGIVALEGDTLAQCVETYFARSEQLLTRFRVAVGRDGRGHWRASVIMLQRLPDQGGAAFADKTAEDLDEDWNRATILLDSVRDDELLDFEQPAERLLYQLFHEDGVRAWPHAPLDHGCTCSEARARSILATFPAEERATMREADGKIHMQCQFCSRNYAFEEGNLDPPP